jgi:hypothetical protein
MKIYINTITQEKVFEEKEKVKEGTTSEKDFADTLSCPTIKGEVFPIGEWKHRDEKWAEDNAKDLEKYPYIKEAYIVLEDKMKQAIEERNLQSFAQGLKEANELYSEALPEIADTVLKISPYKMEII